MIDDVIFIVDVGLLIVWVVCYFLMMENWCLIGLFMYGLMVNVLMYGIGV